jgi:hypothetical protein
MTAYRLGKDAESLGSFAAEGQLLAQAAEQGRAPSTYVATHASELGADCGDLASVVRTTRPTGATARPRRQLAVLASEATALFERLEHAPNDSGDARSIAKRLGEIADQAARIEERV